MKEIFKECQRLRIIDLSNLKKERVEDIR